MVKPMPKKQREMYEEFFLSPGLSKEAARTSNLSVFSQQLSYIAASVCGGKLTTEEADQRVKDLYKVWKRSNRSAD